MYKLLLLSFTLVIVQLNSIAQQSKDSAATKDKIEIDGKVFSKVEIEAEFPGGVKAWTRYLQENLHADIPVKKKAPVGKYQVIVRFIVGKNGRVKDVTAETDHGYGMEKEVIRIIKKGPDWIPAMQDGKPVNAYRRQPVTFLVSEE